MKTSVEGRIYNRHRSRVLIWLWQTVNFTLPIPKQMVKEHKGGVCPSVSALHHPVAELILQYATQGCPTSTGQPWTVADMEAAVIQ